MPVPRAPRPGRIPAFRVPGPLRLAAPRTTSSLDLDRDTGVPFVPWPEFLEQNRFPRGQSITTVGNNGSGKSVLLRELTWRRDYTVVLGTKPQDPELYGGYEDRGFVITDRFDPAAESEAKKVVFKPRLTSPDRKGINKQAEEFRRVLFDVYEYGGWTVVIDELLVIADQMHLDDTLELLWSQGRTLNVSVVGATQQPVDIPLMAYSEAWHLFLFRQNDRRRINRMAEFSGGREAELRELIPRLPEHEFVYVQTRTGKLVRSRVMLEP
jgi:hypothetical protein